MSRERKLTPAAAGLRHLLGELEGSRIAGGCDDCDAFQTTTLLAPGVWTITVHHDDTCPFLALRDES